MLVFHAFTAIILTAYVLTLATLLNDPQGLDRLRVCLIGVSDPGNCASMPTMNFIVHIFGFTLMWACMFVLLILCWQQREQVDFEVDLTGYDADVDVNKRTAQRMQRLTSQASSSSSKPSSPKAPFFVPIPCLPASDGRV